MNPPVEIVISGIAGRFPKSNNMEKLQDNLMNKIDMITADGHGWKIDGLDIPKRFGKINNKEKFDALFFGINSKQANVMDPSSRMLLEHSYEAIIDAGINPNELKKSNTGVFIASLFIESENALISSNNYADNGLALIGCSRAMQANRISHSLDLTGPSYTIDSACSSSVVAVEHAFKAIKNGECDAAIVGCVNICLNPLVTDQFNKLGVLSVDGSCKTFDDNANGYVRSETVGVLFIQKSNIAKRIYAKIIHCKSNTDGYKEDGVTYPSSIMQTKLLAEFYDECGVSPSSIEYIEAHGTGTIIGDVVETTAIESVFCTDRSKPLLIGSTRSNLGHSEPASGMCSMAKVIIANETGIIPPNLHFKNPRKSIKSIIDGKIKVVTEPQAWNGGYIAINSIGFGGTNSHILFKSNDKEKINNAAPDDGIPRIVVYSGRTKEAVDMSLKTIENNKIDVEYIRLLHDIYSVNFSDYIYRGYTILNTNQNNAKFFEREIKKYDGIKRPIYFIFSGIGCQWPAMGSALLCFPIFSEAIKKCDTILRSKNINIYNILTDSSEETCSNIINSSVGITAVQIGLVDLLASLDIVPDYVIGHSVGELACAYADGSLTASQTIQTSYLRSLALTQINMTTGGMAAVGLGHNETKALLPPDIQVACHNSTNNTTVSGPSESIQAFVAELTAKKIFAKEINSNSVPYHSSYIAEAYPICLDYLNKIIPDKKIRSSKWISTSVPQHQWPSMAQFSSAQYYANNLINPVLFKEACDLIPSDAITIEVAPHGLLQSILKTSLDSTVTNITLSQKNHQDNAIVLLKGIGKLFNAGYHPQVSKLYPHVEFPVSRGTPMISPLVKWDHSHSWDVVSYTNDNDEKLESIRKKITIHSQDEKYKFMLDHCIDGRILLPTSGYLLFVWQTFAMIIGKQYDNISVVFENVKLLQATPLNIKTTTELIITIERKTGNFKIIDDKTTIVSGHIRQIINSSVEKIGTAGNVEEEKDAELMDNSDIYLECKVRGYDYTGVFQGIKSCSINKTCGKFIWNNNWITFLDSLIQFKILSVNTENLIIPSSIEKLVIDVKAHEDDICNMSDDDKSVSAIYNKNLDIVISKGVEIRGIGTSIISRKKQSNLSLECYKFVANIDDEEISMQEAIRVATYLALQNNLDRSVKILEFLDTNDNDNFEDLISPMILQTTNDTIYLEAEIEIIIDNNCQLSLDSLPQTVSVMEFIKLTSADSNALMASGKNILFSNKISTILASVKDDGFILTIEKTSNISTPEILNNLLSKYHLKVVFKKEVEHLTIMLLRKHENKMPKNNLIIIKIDDNFLWFNKLQDSIKIDMNNEKKIILVSEKKLQSGILGLLTSLRREQFGEKVRGFVLQDPNAPDFDLTHPLYENQLNLDLAINVLRPGNAWGTYCHLKLPKPISKKQYHGWANVLTRGDLSSLKWLDGPITEDFNHPDLVKIIYSAINYRDFMVATRKIPIETIAHNKAEEECMLGIEYSGVDVDNKKIMGLMTSRSITNLAIVDRNLSWKIPDNWSLEDAATVPCAYGIAYYALYTNGNIKKGEKILIHSGSSGVGQAAIILALNENCEIFTTVGTPEKRKFIKNKFPQILDDHIGYSRDSSFENMILKSTRGRGVDIVLTSFTENTFRASIKCLAKKGRFIKIGNYTMSNDTSIQMTDILSKNISLHEILFDNLLHGNTDEKLKLNKLIQDGLDGGVIKPLARIVYSKNQLEDAFRFMENEKHIGKILIKILDDKNLQNISIPTYPYFNCLGDKCYMIIGGLGGLGLELANWLILRGAKNLVITSRSGIKNGYQLMRIKQWESCGIKVVVICDKNVYNYEDCIDILNEATRIAPVDGIFNLATVLLDRLFKNQIIKNFEESLKAKAWSTINLDKLTRIICPTLRYFVVFSSISCGKGNMGQTNYAMSNSIIERICEMRYKEGLPALAIQWGAVGGAGAVAKMQTKSKKELFFGGTGQQKLHSYLQQLNDLFLQSQTIVASAVIAKEMKNHFKSKNSNIVLSILNIMGYEDDESILKNKPLFELGMDSIMLFETKQVLERQFNIHLSNHDIKNLTFAKLKNMKAKNN